MTTLRTNRTRFGRLATLIESKEICLALAFAGEHGTKRDDIREGLRTFGFERRVTIAFHVGRTTVTIDRILYGGRDIRRAFRKK